MSVSTMPSDTKRFSHVANFTGYMKIAADWFAAQRAGLRVTLVLEKR